MNVVNHSGAIRDFVDAAVMDLQQALQALEQARNEYTESPDSDLAAALDDALANTQAALQDTECVPSYIPREIVA